MTDFKITGEGYYRNSRGDKVWISEQRCYSDNLDNTYYPDGSARPCAEYEIVAKWEEDALISPAKLAARERVRVEDIETLMRESLLAGEVGYDRAAQAIHNLIYKGTK